MPAFAGMTAEIVEREYAMPTQVLMPALSPTMEKGNLSKWIKQEGDTVKAGDVIAEIETDKATMEVEAVDEGKLGKILVPEGTQDVPVNTPIATIVAEGEDGSAPSFETRPSGAPQDEAPRRPHPEEGASAPVSKGDGGDGKAEAPEQAQKGAESAPPAERPAQEARPPAQPKSAAATPPQPAGVPEPDVPDGTEMVTMTVREALRDAMAEEMRRDEIGRAHV